MAPRSGGVPWRCLNVGLNVVPNCGVLMNPRSRRYYVLVHESYDDI